MGGTAIVVGGGAWGLPAALRLQDRGVAVTLVERFAPGGPSASNGGTTRLWRLADTLEWRARSLRDARDALERLGERLGEPVFAHTGLLWRDTESLPAVAAALTSIGEYGEAVAADRVGEVFPGLRPDGRNALYVEQAGVVHAERLLQGALRAFIAAGGQYLAETRVTAVTPGEHSASVRVSSGSGDHADAVLTADQVLIAAGPGTAELLPGLELELPLTPYIEQVVYFGNPGMHPPAPSLPSLVDCPVDGGPEATAGIYAMPNGAAGYKVGLDLPLRPLAGGTLGDDLDRSELPARTAQIQTRVARDLTAITPQVLGTQVCTWTDSGDGDFVVGRTHPTVVLACGDSGEGFKYAAFMGEYLAALIAGETVDPVYQAHWNPRRFGAAMTPRRGHSSIGRH
ncbi:glycine/D-amino acid oxidase-like deaminating enzyme [Leucobacter luti]|uniref:NAD(P)/FAD-dependent oxidoreductase n=1 Tax=Leucobacter luti TaxID=340320 RepID=UPI001049429B|nr:FAD-dependent oxidoreductase [Leucobacter luti]MCW2289763.1 glycine/D-amino acid oxidase-like deaminating enzyme [Leucobacter luti]TCK34299.1 glycine/D-amino acid oxidase-like deaminating enzyme [Leucobacter luti]